MDAAAIEKLEKLGTLMEKGILTKEEFKRQKAALLGSPLPVSTPSVAEVPAVAVLTMPSVVPASPPTTTHAPPPKGTGLRKAAGFLVMGVIGVLVLVLGTGALLTTYLISAERDRVEAERDAIRYEAEQARQAQQAQAQRQAAAKKEKADKEKAEKEAKAKQEAEWRREEEDIIANDMSEADLPMISGALSKCDDRCSTLLDVAPTSSARSPTTGVAPVPLPRRAWPRWRSWAPRTRAGGTFEMVARSYGFC